MTQTLYLLAVPALAALVIYHLYQNYAFDRLWDHIPTHEFDDGDNSRARYTRDLKDLLESGYRKYSKVGKLFKVRIPIGGYTVNVKRLRNSRKYVKEQMAPLYEDLKRRQLLGTLSKEKLRKGNFGYEGLWGGTPDEVTLDDFSDTTMRTSIASIHTTAKTVSVALIDLLSQPQYVDELRKEALDAMEADESIDIEKLFKMDCFRKESQRLTPVFLLTMNRIVTQPYTFKVSGTFMPVGTMATAATAAIATDPDTFGVNSNEFEGGRFERVRLDNKAGESAFKVGMATEDSLGFGLGSQACPGRFFAVNQMKLVLAKLITRWDLILEKNGQTYTSGRPKYEYYDFSVVAPVEYGMRLKKNA